MVKQGIGKIKQKPTQKIIEVLNDENWHRYKELQDKTELSTATLSKHLKELEKGIVERHLDADSVEYPPPVRYHLRQEYKPTQGNPVNSGVLAKRSKYITDFGQLDNYWREFISETIPNIMFLLQKHFQVHKQSEQSREAFNQSLELIYLQSFREHAQNAMEKLEELSDNGVDVVKIINESSINIMKDTDYILKQGKKILDKRRIPSKK